MFRLIPALVLGLIVACSVASAASVVDASAGWRFHRGEVTDGAARDLDDAGWPVVDAPHPARIEALVTTEGGEQQWEGICWYRKTLNLPPSAVGQLVHVRFEGAMNRAELFVDGIKRAESLDGYTPFVVDLTEEAATARPIQLALRLDNQHNPDIGPKPRETLDFHLYHGLYRTVALRVLPRLHITDEILEDQPASGGILVTYPVATDESATVATQVHVRNASPDARAFTVEVVLRTLDGAELGRTSSPSQTLNAGDDRAVVAELVVARPALWSPLSPTLHWLEVELRHGDEVVDSRRQRIGLRRMELGLGGLVINGRPQFLRGVNRHQEYPYVGIALPANAQYRDALKIKQAGFDYVRLSHYPQSPAFMDACDELGLITMNAILGWQFNPGTPAFMANRLAAARALVRRDRNRPSVVFWELALNETRMSPAFITALHEAGHEELPGGQMFTAGWVPGYDVKMTARQHHSTREFLETALPSLVSEYGDWEYYAQNAGLNQDQWANLEAAERNSRQLRRHGEVRLLQQATNLQEAHNENRGTRAMGDGYWVMYDYNRGYAEDHEASGVMDIFRLPKFSYFFFQSQRDPEDQRAGVYGGPMVFVATWWTPDSPLAVRVFSNCDEVELMLNGSSLGRQPPDRDKLSTHLARPPFTFSVGAFEPGELKAIGYIEGRPVAEHGVRTPQQPARLELAVDLSGRPVATGGDVVFVYARLVDHDGTVVPSNEVDVRFTLSGDASLIGQNPIQAEAGIATIVLKTGATAGTIEVSAQAEGLPVTKLQLFPAPDSIAAQPRPALNPSATAP